MDRIEIFQILGIEETKDERRIKNAYREKLSVTNPEDDPEGFKRLRNAYEEACRLAKDSGEGQEEQPRDTTPSGLWVEKAAEIYHNIRTRQDLRRWEKLFMEDCFLSLEDEENCRFKLLRFLMEHFKLPTEVWKLLDKKLSITGDAAKLREQFPADFVRYLLNKCERGEDVEFSRFQGPEDGDYDLYLQYYDRIWQAFAEGKLEEAARCMESADRLGISHPVMEICRGELLHRRGKDAEAVALMEALLEKYPKDAMVSYNTAELLWKQGQAEDGRFRKKAVQIYQELKEENDNHYMANARLTEWYYEEGQYKKAKSCAEKVLSGGSDDAFMELLIKINAEIEKELEEDYRKTKKWEPALELCWCYLQDGKISRGIRLAASIEKQLPPEKEAEFNGLMAKLYVEEAEYEDSITMTYAWEEALHKKLDSNESEDEKRDRDRLKQARLIRMQCYHNLGFKDREQFGKAVEEGNGLLTDSAKDIGVLLEQAQLYVEMEEFDRCLELADRLLDNYQVYAAYAVSLEAYRRQLDAAGVVRSGRQCIQFFPDFVKAYEYVAKVYLDLNYREDLEKLLEEAEKNNVKSDILDAYRYQLTHRTMELSVLNDKLRNFRDKYLYCIEDHLKNVKLYEDGLKIITEYLYHYPESYLFVERGEYHREAHHYEEARKDYEKALALDPVNSRGLHGLSRVYRVMGDYEKALIYMKRAILYMDEDNNPLALYQEMGELYSLLGDNRRALSVCLECVRMQGASPGFTSLNNLMEARLRVGQLEEAEQISGQMNGADGFLDYAYRGTLCRRGGDRRKARELQETWRRKLASWRRTPGMERADLIGRGSRSFDRKIRGDAQSKALYGNFFDYSAWVELIFGDPGEAVRYLRECIVCRTPPLCRSIVEHEKADIVFACILCGDDTQGKKYSERLRKRMKEAEEAKPKDGDDFFCNEYKRGLYYRILSCFYTASPQEIQGLLDQEKGMTSCNLCTRPFCSELEGIRILLLYRQGKQQEARERLERNLEILPQDEYLRAIKHSVFDMTRKT